MEVAYFLAGSDVAPKLDALLAENHKKRRKADKIATTLGATNVYWQGGVIAGFQFPGNPGSRFKRLKKTSDGWGLKRCKENDPLIEQLAELATDGTAEIGKIVGLKPSLKFDDEGGGRFRVTGGAGCEKVGDKFIITVNKEDGKPKGCKRISDLEREKLLNGKRR